MDTLFYLSSRAYLPVLIFLTGDAGGDETQEFLEATRAPVLNKPFNLVDLRGQIQARDRARRAHFPGDERFPTSPG